MSARINELAPKPTPDASAAERPPDQDVFRASANELRVPGRERLGVIRDSGRPVEAACEAHRYLTMKDVVSDPAEPHET